MQHTQSIVEIVQAVSKRPTVPGPDESLFDGGYLDSFGLPDMICALEERFAICIPDTDLSPRKFGSIATIERYIDQAVTRPTS